ncbi:protein translocase subunit SecF [Candidatus Uhrbacteria bacterium]|nr:protein translocase subunit SecF [Candidatus Uhrbacteria bacterium]
MSVVKHRLLCYIVSGALVVASVVSIAVFGLRLGIDFTGGSILEVTYESAPAIEDVRMAIEGAGFTGGSVQPANETGVLLRQRTLSEEQHQQLLTVLETFGDVDELRFDSIGPVIGQELMRKSLIALVLIFLATILYVAWSFRKASHYVTSWKYGCLTVVAAIHDVIIPVGVFAVLGATNDVTIGTAFVAALLTILGYSVNDTIVIFDRVRENVLKGGEAFDDIVDKSIRQTLARSVNTTLTTLLSLVAIFFFGGETTKDFALALMIGIGVGAYSSIFIAAPLLVTWQKRVE